MRRSSRLATLSRTPRGATSFARALQQTEMLKDTNPETILAAVEKLAAHRSDFDEDFVPTPQIKPKRRKKQTATKVAPIKKPGPLQGEPKQSTLTDWVRNNLPVKPKRTPPKTRPTKPRRTPAPKRPVKPKKQYVKQPKRPKSMPLATFLKEALKKQAVTSKKQSVALYKLIESAADPRLLSEEIAADFFPDSERSAPFVTSKDPESPKAQIPVLRSCQFSENEKTVSKLIFYAGGTVSSLAWLKIREKYQDDPDREHFLAIGVHQEINPIHFNGKQFSSKNMIQIWSIQGLYTPSEQSPLHQKSATFCIGICHEYGCVFEVQWCPYTSTYEDDELSNHVGGKKSLGLLSACFGDGTLRVFNVPHPDSITRTKAREPLYVQLEPVLTFRIENTNILRASWKVTSTDAYLLYCNSSGTACVWHGIHNQENKEYIDEEKEINAPMISFRAHKKEIIALAWHPTNPYLFLTTSHQPPIKVWDIRDPVMPVFSHKNIHKTTSLRYWNSTFSEVITASALGNIVLLKDSNTNSRVYYTHYGPIWDLSVSEYLQQAATCSEDGSCNATFIKDFPNKIRSSDVCLTIQMAELDQREDGVLILQFPGSSILVKKAEVLKVDSFPDLVIGWSTLAWSPNKQSCNWLACGANVGLVCIVPYLSDVPITKKRT